MTGVSQSANKWIPSYSKENSGKNHVNGDTDHETRGPIKMVGL